MINIYSPSVHRNLYQSLIECFSNCIPIQIISDILNEEDIDVVIDKIVDDKIFQKPDMEIEIYESMEKLKNPQEHEDGGIIMLDDLNEKEKNDPRLQAMFKRFCHHNLPIFIISRDY